jgi:hypothetical protein
MFSDITASPSNTAAMRTRASAVSHSLAVYGLKPTKLKHLLNSTELTFCSFEIGSKKTSRPKGRWIYFAA